MIKYTVISLLTIQSAQLGKLDTLTEALNIPLLLSYSLGGHC